MWFPLSSINWWTRYEAKMKGKKRNTEKRETQEEVDCVISSWASNGWVGIFETTIEDDCFPSELNILNIILVSMTKLASNLCAACNYIYFQWSRKVDSTPFTENIKNHVKGIDLTMCKDIKTSELCGNHLGLQFIFSFMSKAENGSAIWNGYISLHTNFVVCLVLDFMSSYYWILGNKNFNFLKIIKGHGYCVWLFSSLWKCSA